MAASQANVGQGSYNYPSMPQGMSLGSMNNAEFTNYVNTSLYQLANYSMMQVEQQWKQEEIQVKTGIRHNLSVSCMVAKNHLRRVQAAYNNYMQTKANAYSTVQKASSGMYDRELGISGSSFNKKSSVRLCLLSMS